MKDDRCGRMNEKGEMRDKRRGLLQKGQIFYSTVQYGRYMYYYKCTVRVRNFCFCFQGNNTFQWILAVNFDAQFVSHSKPMKIIIKANKNYFIFCINFAKRGIIAKSRKRKFSQPPYPNLIWIQRRRMRNNGFILILTFLK